MSWFGGLEKGDHVRAKTDLRDGLLSPSTVPRGRKGIVREIDRGLLTDRATVEFYDGMWTRTVRGIPTHQLSKTGGQGDTSFRQGLEWRRGVRLGLLLCNIPLIVALVRYYLAGGTTAGLVPAVLDAALALAMALLGHPLLLVVVAALVLVRRARTSR